MIVLLALLLAFGQSARVRMPPQGTAAIAGRVLGTDGQPIARASVRAVPVGRGFSRAVVTDADGRYELTGLRAGAYRVEAGKPGFLTIQYLQRRPFEPGAAVTVRDAGRLDAIDIVLAKHGAIMGRVTDETGDPVEGASVRVSQIAFVDGRRQLVDVPGVGTRLTDDRGHYRIYGLPPGRYVVCAVVGQIEFPGPDIIDMPGYATTFYPGTPTASGAALIDVGLSADVTGIDFPLVPAPTARVYGRASSSSGDPITGGLTMRSSARSGGVAGEAGAIINPDGTFIFPNVAPGEYVIQAFRSRVNNWTEGEFASRIVEVNGADVVDVDVRTSAGSEVTGRVTIDDPTATLSPRDVQLTPSAADLDLAPSSGGIAHAEIAGDWTFELAGLNGPRRLRLTSAPHGWMLKSVLLNGTDITDGVLEFGSPRQSLQGVQVVLTRSGAEITGVAVDASGAPAPQASVIVFPVDPSQRYPDSRFLEMVPQKDGAFDVTGLPSGDYYVAAVNRLASDEWQDPALLEELSSKAARVFATEGQKITASPMVVVR